MQRITASFEVTDIGKCKQQMLNWGNQFDVCCFLDSHEYADTYTSYDCLLAAGAVTAFSVEKNVLPQLQTFAQQHTDWLFGHVSYDLKNEAERLTSSNIDIILFPAVFFFQPETVITLKKGVLTIECLQQEPQNIYKEIKLFEISKLSQPQTSIQVQSRISRQQYINSIRQLQQHILKGDCYEINFCQEFFTDKAAIDALATYKKLSSLSPAPFAAYYKLHDKYALCASPERYIKKRYNRIISQPIKGTAKRNLLNKEEDEQLKNGLYNSPKNRSENVMITDLVRNDLSKICKEGTVKVKELFGLYSYPQVHQLVTTVAGEVNPDINIAEVLGATFPMGSMTGAPKRRVMQLAEQYESTKRSLYSGTIGYISPANDFDFNVVIRSILYNESTACVSFQAGSAITFYSDAEEEYEECLLKAKSLRQVLCSDNLQ